MEVPEFPILPGSAPVLIIGASSFLGTNLFPRINDMYKVQTICTHLGQKVPYEFIQDKLYRCVIYLKPDADPMLKQVRGHVPVLSIGSGALVDFKAGRIPHNAYIEGKQALVEMSSVTIHPGFFIPNASHIDTGRGLHRETLLTLFGANAATLPASFSLDKAYYITPVDKLLEMIVRFIENPTQFHGEYPFGSVFPISRRALISDTSLEVNALYVNDMKRTKDEFGMEVSFEDCLQFGEQARAWVKKIENKA